MNIEKFVELIQLETIKKESNKIEFEIEYREKDDDFGEWIPSKKCVISKRVSGYEVVIDLKVDGSAYFYNCHSLENNKLTMYAKLYNAIQDRVFKYEMDSLERKRKSLKEDLETMGVL